MNTLTTVQGFVTAEEELANESLLRPRPKMARRALSVDSKIRRTNADVLSNAKNHLALKATSTVNTRKVSRPSLPTRATSAPNPPPIPTLKTPSNNSDNLLSPTESESSTTDSNQQTKASFDVHVRNPRNQNSIKSLEALFHKEPYSSSAHYRSLFLKGIQAVANCEHEISTLEDALALPEISTSMALAIANGKFDKNEKMEDADGQDFLEQSQSASANRRQFHSDQQRPSRGRSLPRLRGQNRELPSVTIMSSGKSNKIHRGFGGAAVSSNQTKPSIARASSDFDRGVRDKELGRVHSTVSAVSMPSYVHPVEPNPLKTPSGPADALPHWIPSAPTSKYHRPTLSSTRATTDGMIGTKFTRTKSSSDDAKREKARARVQMYMERIDQKILTSKHGISSTWEAQSTPQKEEADQRAQMVAAPTNDRRRGLVKEHDSEDKKESTLDGPRIHFLPGDIRTPSEENSTEEGDLKRGNTTDKISQSSNDSESLQSTVEHYRSLLKSNERRMKSFERNLNHMQRQQHELYILTRNQHNVNAIEKSLERKGKDQTDLLHQQETEIEQFKLALSEAQKTCSYLESTIQQLEETSQMKDELICKLEAKIVDLEKAIVGGIGTGGSFDSIFSTNVKEKEHKDDILLVLRDTISNLETSSRAKDKSMSELHERTAKLEKELAASVKKLEVSEAALKEAQSIISEKRNVESAKATLVEQLDRYQKEMTMTLESTTHQMEAITKEKDNLINELQQKVHSLESTLSEREEDKNKTGREKELNEKILTLAIALTEKDRELTAFRELRLEGREQNAVGDPELYLAMKDFTRVKRAGKDVERSLVKERQRDQIAHEEDESFNKLEKNSSSSVSTISTPSSRSSSVQSALLKPPLPVRDKVEYLDDYRRMAARRQNMPPKSVKKVVERRQSHGQDSSRFKKSTFARDLAVETTKTSDPASKIQSQKRQMQRIKPESPRNCESRDENYMATTSIESVSPRRVKAAF